MHANLLLLLFATAFSFLHVLARPNFTPMNNDDMVDSNNNNNTTGLQPRQSQVGDQIMTQVFTCSGHLNGAPHYDCPPATCSSWLQYLGPNWVEVEASGVNCIDTDCHTDFQVCNKHGYCNSIYSFTPSENSYNRCSWTVPGTESLHIWAEP